MQLLQFQQDVEQAQLSRIQALSDLRQQLGYESVPADYRVAGAFDYQPLALTLAEQQAKALRNRPDLRAALQGVTAASLLDFLDAERSYRATQLAWRQAIAAYLTALEQLRAAVGTRSLP